MNPLGTKNLIHIIYDRASLARATRVGIHYIFTLGPSSLGIEKRYY